MERRDFIKFLFGGCVVGTLLAGGSSITRAKIRPPGAVSEISFLAACARCGKCAEICPRGAIKIAHGDDGLGIGTPYIVPQEQYCDLCMKCVEVCSAGALRAVEKSKTRMGVAHIDTDRCIARTDDDCRVCYNNCPYMDKAIKLENRKYPYINPEFCTGCGKCEHVCIASPVKACTVSPIEE